METYELIRRSVLLDGMSQREASREYGLNRRTVSKMLETPVPPGYGSSKPRPKPKTGEFVVHIARILKEDETAPKKQRHTAKRIFQRLRDEYGYRGGPCQVGREVRKIRALSRETFIPLVSVPGEAEADFGESVVEIAGRRVKAHVFQMVLPLSGVWFACAYPAENAESFCDGNVRAFQFFGAVPRRCVYDNTSLAVSLNGKPVRGREPVLTRSFAELRSAFLFGSRVRQSSQGKREGIGGTQGRSAPLGVLRSRAEG